MGPGPGRPTYLETSYSRDDISNGVPLPPVGRGAKPAASPPNTPPAPPADSDPVMEFRSAMRSAPAPEIKFTPPEKPVPPETTDALIQAVNKVHRVVTARIKYHEAEAARLRASVAPFATMAYSGEPPPAQPTSESAINLLVELAKALPDPPEAAP